MLSSGIWSTLYILFTPVSELEKLANDRDTWRSVCASGLSTSNWSQMSAVQPSVCLQIGLHSHLRSHTTRPSKRS